MECDGLKLQTQLPHDPEVQALHLQPILASALIVRKIPGRFGKYPKMDLPLALRR